MRSPPIDLISEAKLQDLNGNFLGGEKIRKRECNRKNKKDTKALSDRKKKGKGQDSGDWRRKKKKKGRVDKEEGSGGEGKKKKKDRKERK